MKISEIQIDPEKLENGAWVKEIPEMEGLELRVRGIGCAEFRKLQAKLFEAIPRSRRLKGRVSQEDQDRILDTCLHRVILLDWRGIEDDADQPIAYEKGLALEYLTNPKFKKFREAVVWAASTVAEDDAADVEEAVGNSPPPSAGTSTGEAENPS